MSAGGRPGYAPEREARFAVVMYGGVSLAIYINGVAQELLRMVRATAPNQDADALHFADAEIEGRSDAVYRELAQRLRGDGSWDAGAPRDSTPVRTRFVVDILSGTSAGGINGIFLAKALATGRDIDVLKQMWVDEGDIAKLFNEAANYPGLGPDVRFVKPPTALLIGQRLYVKAREAFKAMERQEADADPDAARPRFAEQVDLAVTTTDLQGLRLPIQLTDMAVQELRHRTVLRFVYATDEATGAARDDFDGKDGKDDVLAFAARATSSFPFAFEPVLLADVDKAVPGAVARIQDQGHRWFGDYVSAGVDYERFAFADGGYLDNKPFSSATSALRRRRADVPVSRKLLYIEPDPGAPIGPEALQPKERPDAVGNVGAALVGLPRVEAIRDDIDAVRERNAAIERIRRITRQVEVAALLDDEDLSASDAYKLSYRRLRRLEVIDDLAALVVRAIDLWPGGDRAKAVRLLLDAWAPAGADLQRFLDAHDLRYRLRQIELLQDRINVLLTGGHGAAELLQAAGAGLESDAGTAGPGAEWLRERKRLLNEAYVELRRRGRAARSRKAQVEKTSQAGDAPQQDADALAAIREAARGLRLDGADLERIVQAGDTDEEAKAVAQAERGRALAEFAAELRAYFEPHFAAADERVGAALAAGPGDPPVAAGLARVLQGTHGCAEAVDMAVLPLVYPDLGERNAVEIYRVSPDDADGVCPGRVDGKSRLAGAAVGHFGAFLKEDWRRTDLLWGRLDGAERIVAALVPDAGAREAYRVRAQAAILREELRDPRTAEAVLEAGAREAVVRAASHPPVTLGDDERLIELFRRNYKPPGELDSGLGFALGASGLSISGDVLAGVAKSKRLPSRPVVWLARVGVLGLRMTRRLRRLRRR